MEVSLPKTLLRHVLESSDDETFIERVNALYGERGIEVLVALFRLLAGIDMPPKQCAAHWEGFLLHRKTLAQRLGRNLDLTAALCDYLRFSTSLLNHPRLIDAGHFEEMLEGSINDKLTGLFNRRYFDEIFSQQVALAERYRNDFTILFLDIDDFKELNDTYGHLAGDRALAAVAQIIAREKRTSDVAARFGGEEFVVLMPHTDNISGFVFAERLRLEIEAMRIPFEDVTLNLTVSGGIASFPLNTENPRQLVQLADSAVYLAKGAGKNTIAHYKEEKRRYLRVKIQQPVLVKELDFHDTATFSGTSKDIGIGGILFENDTPLPLGALITVQLAVNEDTPLLLIGTVVRVETFANDRYDIGMTTTFKEMDKVANAGIAGILRLQNVT
jgi:diguanylate cyclase (GGDEF)-like protein